MYQNRSTPLILRGLITKEGCLLQDLVKASAVINYSFLMILIFVYSYFCLFILNRPVNACFLFHAVPFFFFFFLSLIFFVRGLLPSHQL